MVTQTLTEPPKELQETALKHIRNAKYKGSVAESTWTAVVTLSLFVAAVAVGNFALGFECACTRLPLSAVATLLWAGAVLRSFMIFHDAGHGSYVQTGTATGRFLNTAFKYVFSTCCGTPTDWNVGHKLHHLHVGNMDQDHYDWGETIFHTRQQFDAWSPAAQWAYRILRHPAVFFPIAPLLTWYIKMRLPFELRPEREAAYRFSDKMLNLATMVIRYTCAYHAGLLPVVFAGDYLAMGTGVLLFHWQHVYEPGGYVTHGDKKWDRYEASFEGSSFLQVHPFFQFFTLGIEYHHIHHLHIRVPGYALQRCHEDADEEMWKTLKIRKLYPSDLWKSLYLTLYDMETRIFVPFPSIGSSSSSAKKKVA